MHFSRARASEQLHDMPGGGTAHDRIVDQHDAFAAHCAGWGEFEQDLEFA